jgi:hypothetical protein
VSWHNYASGTGTSLDDGDGDGEGEKLFRSVPSLSQLLSNTRLLRPSFALVERTFDSARLTPRASASSQGNHVQRLACAKTSRGSFARIISTASHHTQGGSRTPENIETLKVQQDHIQA